MANPVLPNEIITKKGGFIFLVAGLSGVGKSTFTINSHEIDQPLYYANFDRDASRILSQYKGDLIYTENFRVADTKIGAGNEIRKLQQFVSFACGEKQGVFVLDNIAACWNIISKAFLPDEDRPAPKEYSDANGCLRTILLTLEDSGLTTILTSPVKEQWVSASKTSGLLEPDVWKHLQFHAVTEVYLFRTGKMTAVAPFPVETPTMGVFKGLIMEAKLQPSAIGVIIDNPTMKDITDITT